MELNGSRRMHLLHTLLGIMGNIASLWFFLSSVPTVVRMVRSRSSGGLSGDLYVLKLFNCLLWVFYGLPFIHPHDFWVVLTNGLGCFFACCYILPYLVYASRFERISVAWKLFVVLCAFISMATSLLTLDLPRKDRITIAGVFCVVISSCMHLTLLSQCDKVLQSKDSKYLHPNSSVAAFVKGAIWLAYGVVDLDVFILIPNAIGVLIGIVQMVILATVVLYCVDGKNVKPGIIGSTGVDVIDPEIGSSPDRDNVTRVPSSIGLPRSSSTIVPVDDIDTQNSSSRTSVAK